MSTESGSVSCLNLSIFFLLILLFLPPHYHCSQRVYNITPVKPLPQGDTLVSPSGVFKLGFFSPDGFAQMYVGFGHKKISPRKVVWVANRDKPLAVADKLASLRVHGNGSLELVDGKNSSVWSTNTTVQVPSSNTSSVVAYLSDKGNFSVKDRIGGGELWSSFSNPSDTILPYQLLGFEIFSGRNNVMISWKGENDPSPGVIWLDLLVVMS